MGWVGRLPRLEELDVVGKRVLVRADLNVPLRGGEIVDDYRIRATLPTLRYLLERGASLVVMSHLGRPKGPDPSLRLDPVARRLEELLGLSVFKVNEVTGAEARRAAEGLGRGEILVLENLRFDPRETKNEPTLAKELASLGEAYVNDAFGAAHRAHVSVEALPRLLPAAAGLLLMREVEVLEGLLVSARRPFVCVLGGAKVSDKLGALLNLLGKADVFLIGGAMANTFLAARGERPGASRVEEEMVDEVAAFLARAEAAGARVEVPEDLVVAEEFSERATTRVVPASGVPAGWYALDIGPGARESFAKAISEAGTVFWNGPMGVFEWPEGRAGTEAVARAVASCPGFRVVGGGETGEALRELGLENGVDHLSTGGGASLEFLEGRELPGLRALAEAAGR